MTNIGYLLGLSHQSFLNSDHCMKSVTYRAVALLGALLMSTGIARAEEPVKPEFLKRVDKIISQQALGVGGLIAWTVEKSGQRMVFYTTPDGQAVIAGNVWDGRTGRNLSTPVNQLAKATQTRPILAAELDGKAAVPGLKGLYKGVLPESMKTVDSLAGIKEGKGAVADTLYILVDPRCPYCRKAYQETRAYIRMGYSIKWIPFAALANPDQAMPKIAAILQSKDPEILAKILGQHADIGAVPTAATITAAARTREFFDAATAQGGGLKGVPVGFFLDHRTGKPSMTTGLSEAVILQDIFGQPQ